jgi:hypothetical protein
VDLYLRLRVPQLYLRRGDPVPLVHVKNVIPGVSPENFKTRNLTPFKKDDRVNLYYFSEEFSLLHVRTELDQVIEGIYYEPSEEKKMSPLVNIKDLEFKLLKSNRKLKMRLVAKSFESSLSEDVHFCGLTEISILTH